MCPVSTSCGHSIQTKKASLNFCRLGVAGPINAEDWIIESITDDKCVDALWFSTDITFITAHAGYYPTICVKSRKQRQLPSYCTGVVLKMNDNPMQVRRHAHICTDM